MVIQDILGNIFPLEVGKNHKQNDFADDALGYLISRFIVPLEHAAADTSAIIVEWIEGHATVLPPVSESCSRAERCDMVESF